MFHKMCLKFWCFFQAFLFGASVIGPGTIFLMIVSAVEIAVGMSAYIMKQEN